MLWRDRTCIYFWLAVFSMLFWWRSKYHCEFLCLPTRIWYLWQHDIWILFLFILYKEALTPPSWQMPNRACNIEIKRNYFCIFFFPQYCSLCCLRGGALKPTTDKRWVHIVCALAIGEVYFKNVRARGPINISKITPKRLKLVSQLQYFMNYIIRH